LIGWPVGRGGAIAGAAGGACKVDAADGSWIDAGAAGRTLGGQYRRLLKMANDAAPKATATGVVRPAAGTDQLSVAFFAGRAVRE